MEQKISTEFSSCTKFSSLTTLGWFLLLAHASGAQYCQGGKNAKKLKALEQIHMDHVAVMQKQRAQVLGAETGSELKLPPNLIRTREPSKKMKLLSHHQEVRAAKTSVNVHSLQIAAEECKKIRETKRQNFKGN